MPLNLLGQIFGAGIGAAASAANTKQINETNLTIARETNAANREMVEMQNKAAKDEAELAYKRSSAPNQVNLMTSAGMSRAGAINALNGGGSYTPAPVNTSQDSAPQMQTTDFSALGNIAQAFAQRAQQKHDEKMQNKQLEEQKRQFNEQLEFEKQKWQDEAPFRAENLTAVQFQNKINSELANYTDKDGKKTNLLVEGQAAERLANLAEAKFNALKFDLINAALELPADAFRAFMLELRDSYNDAESFISNIRRGEVTAREIENTTNNDQMLPTEFSQDGVHYRIVRNDDGSIRFVEERR